MFKTYMHDENWLNYFRKDITKSDTMFTTRKTQYYTDALSLQSVLQRQVI